MATGRCAEVIGVSKRRHGHGCLRKGVWHRGCAVPHGRGAGRSSSQGAGCGVRGPAREGLSRLAEGRAKEVPRGWPAWNDLWGQGDWEREDQAGRVIRPSVGEGCPLPAPRPTSATGRRQDVLESTARAVGCTGAGLWITLGVLKRALRHTRIYWCLLEGKGLNRLEVMMRL